MDKMPVIRLEVQIPPEQIMQCIMVHQTDINKYVEEGVKTAIANIEPLIKSESKRLTEEAINSSLEGYFKYGNGRDAINSAVVRALDRVMAGKKKVKGK